MKKLGKFEIIEKVGQGAMGVVYKARDPFIGRIVALKTLTTGLSNDPSLLKRFYSEARSAGSLQHPNIVTIYELGHEVDMPFIAMQFLDGESLDRVIDRRPNLPLFQKIGFIVYVCRALGYAHKQNPPVVHRDIKPANVMLTSEGAVMVVDFGIARLGESTLTQSAGLLIGTLGYMSPQLFRGGVADAHSDIWATGVMFYELLAYRRPFECDDAAGLMSKITLGNHRSITEAAPGTPQDIAVILERMLAKEVDARYHSMDEVLSDLEPIWRRLQEAEVSRLFTNSKELLEAGDLKNAKARVSQIIQIDPSNTQAKSLLEKINAELRRKQIVPQLQARVEKAERLLSNGQVEDAKAEVEAALKLDPTFEPARQLIGQVQAAIERARNITQALRTSKQRMAEGALTEAVLQLDKVLEIDPGNAAACEQLEQIRKERSKRERKKRRDEAVHRARIFWTNLQYDECINLLLTEQNEFPGDSEITKLLESARQDQAEQQRQSLLKEARNLLSAQRFDDALRALDLVLGRYPADSTARNLRTHALQGREQQKRERQLAEGKLKLRELVKGGGYQQAITQAGQLSKEFPDDFELAELLSFARAEQVQLEQKHHLERYSKKIQQALKASRFSEAVQTAEKALLEFPKNLDLLALLDRAKKEQSETEKRELLKQRLREVQRLMDRQELTDAIDLARQTLATVGQDSRIADTLFRAEKEFQFREQQKGRIEAVQTARTLLDDGKLGDATLILKNAVDTQLFSSNDPGITQLLEEIDAKKQLPPPPTPATRPDVSAGPVPAPATSFGDAFSSGTKDDAGKDYVYTRGAPIPEVPGPPEPRAAAEPASATSLGSPSVQPIFAPPSESTTAKDSATSFAAPTGELESSLQDVRAPLPIQEPPEPAAVQTPTEGALETPRGLSISNLWRKPAVPVAAGVLLLAGIGVTSYIIRPHLPRTPAPTAEEIALKKDADQLRDAHHFHDAIARYQALVDLRGAEAPAATNQIESIKHLLAQENSLMETAKAADDRKDLDQAGQAYQQVMDLHGERAAEAKIALDTINAERRGLNNAQIADNNFDQGVNAFGRHDYSTAKSAFEQALHRGLPAGPKRVEARYYLRKIKGRLQQEQYLNQAQTDFKTKNYDAARSEANQAKNVPDGDPLVNNEATNLIASIPKPQPPPVTPPQPPPKNYLPVISAVRAAIGQGQWDEAVRRLQELPPSEREYAELNTDIQTGRDQDKTFTREMDDFRAAEAIKNESALRAAKEYFKGVAAQGGRHSNEARTVINVIDADLRTIVVSVSPKVTNPAALPPRNDATEILDVLQQFAHAYTKGDFEQVKKVRVFKPAEEKKVKEQFKSYHGIPTALSNCVPEIDKINVESAKARCTVSAAGNHSETTYFLQRFNGQWKIVGSN